MRFSPRPFVVAAAALLVATTAAAQRHFADVSGKWATSVNMGERTTESLITLKQSGDTITGTIESEQTGSRPLEGMVKGDTVRFNFSIDMQGNMMAIQGDGVLKDKDTMTGQLVLPNGMGNLPFAAKRTQ